MEFDVSCDLCTLDFLSEYIALDVIVLEKNARVKQVE
jgi:hypothetical protein